MALLPVAKAAAATTAGLLGAAWLNDKYAVSSDLSQLIGMRHGRKYYQHMLHEHGDSDWSFYHVLHCTHGTNDYAQAFVFEDRSWTYGELRGEVGRLAERLKEMGIGNRTVVGMYVNNSPELIVLWFALYKVGAIPAPVNTAVTRGPFTHCLRISGAEAFVTSYELWDKACESLGLGKGEGGMKQILPKMKTVAVYDYGTYPRAMTRMPLQRADMVIVQSELPEVTPQMGDFPKDTRPRIRADDTSCYLFTSGTTGFPKAAVWPAAYSLMSTAPRRWPYMYEVPRRMYICMPMFHGSAA
jgi:acyl-CoA synthetase (AMP-forming)/AMP-acid ligase II